MKIGNSLLRLSRHHFVKSSFTDLAKRQEFLHLSKRCIISSSTFDCMTSLLSIQQIDSPSDRDILNLSDEQRRKASSSARPRRRRRGGTAETISSKEGGEDDDRAATVAPTSSSIVTDDSIFIGSARAFLDKIEEGLEPMRPYNDVFVIQRSKNEEGENLTLRLKPSEGQYIFQVDEEMKTITLNSPMSGTYTYVLCAYTGDFVGMNDGHLCQGLLVRDLIRHTNGLPKF